MSFPHPPSEQELHAYVDGRLSGERRQALERYLAEHPELAAELQGWQEDIRRLRAALESSGHHERIETVRGTGYRFRGT